MRAWQIVSGGGVDALELTERPAPEPGPGQVAIKVHASSINYRDLTTIEDPISRGLPLPTVPNSDAAGVVTAVGPGVTSVAVGDHVSMSFIPSCGRCKWCSTGRQYLCDEGAKLFDIGMMSDGREAHHCNG